MKKKNYLVVQLVKAAAEKIGAHVVIEPKWKAVGQITFKNGKRCYFRNTSLDLNPMGASEITKDKDYATFFLKKLGYPTIEGKTFYSKKWCEAIHSKENINRAYAYACKLGFPVIVKPNSKSQGVGVAKVSTRAEFYKAARFIFTKDNVMLVQRFITGKDYRIVVVDDKIISAYERLPLSIEGDGKSSVVRLLEKKQAEFKKLERDTLIKSDDYRIAAKLLRQKISFETVLEKGRKIDLLDNANLSTGGTSLDVTDAMHADFKKIAIRITKDMGLRLCGVDLMINGDISLPSGSKNGYAVIEINSAPGLDHYYASGAKQKKIVAGLYQELVIAMSK